MSRRALYAGVLIALATSACATSERSGPPSTESPEASTSQASSAPSVTTSNAPTGPVTDILRARQLRADDYHEMSFGGETPESMTNQPGQVAFITPTANIACNWSPADPTTELGLNCLAKERTSPPPHAPQIASIRGRRVTSN
jgi:hypothetical protein